MNLAASKHYQLGRSFPILIGVFNVGSVHLTVQLELTLENWSGMDLPLLITNV